MDYLVPAWHTRLGNWAYGTPNLNFDDIVSVAGLLSSGNINYGLVITDYLPQLSTRLANIAITPQKVLNVFDGLQGITQVDNQTLDYEDFDWPAGALFEFTPFHLIVRQGTKCYANVIFDMEGKINWIEYFDENERHTKTLLMDSRGFVSRVEYYDENNQQVKDSFLNQSGEWRFNYFPQNDTVDINPLFAEEFAQLHYDHLNDLIAEVVEQHFLNRLTNKDRLIITVDDQSRFPQTKYAEFQTVFSASKWHPFEQSLRSLAQLSDITLVTDTQFTGERAQEIMHTPQHPVAIPLYQALFQLGHSQRISGQRIYLFIDPLDEEQVASLGAIILDQLIQHPKRDELHLLSYGGGREKAEHFTKLVQQRHHGRLWVKGHEPKKKVENEGIEDDPRKKEKVLPTITIKYEEYSDTPSLMKALDKARLLIDGGEHPDDLLQMAAVSIGIPVLQRIETAEIRDQQNGRICQDRLDLKAGLQYYLDDINHWNAALANDVQIMNQYSADKLLQMWQAVWQDQTKGNGKE